MKTRFDKYEKRIVTSEEEEIREKFTGHIGNNLMYANPKIISAYHDLISCKYADYMEDYTENIRAINLFIVFLDNIIILNKKSFFDKFIRRYRLLDEETTSKLHSFRTTYLVWLILYKILLDMDKTTRILRFVHGYNANHKKMLKINKRFTYQPGDNAIDKKSFLEIIRDMDKLLASKHSKGGPLSGIAEYIYDNHFENR